MSTILLSGYYGYGNIGDEAVLGGILAGLREELPEFTPVVLSGDPESTSRMHDVTAISRTRLGAITSALKEASLFISGGGSLLQDVTSRYSPLYYLGMLWLAQRAGVPSMVLAQGMGPLNHPANRFLARRILDATRAITVRDAMSAEWLAALGVSKPPIEVTADPSFLLQADRSARLDAWWDAHIPADRPVLAVSLRRWAQGNPSARYTAIADALAAFVADSGAFLLFLPMQYDRDLPIAEELAGWTPAESRVLNLPITPREMMAAVGRCDFILGMRLHALIFAVQQATPALGLVYDPKVLDFSLLADLPTSLRWEELTTDALLASLRHHWEQRDALRAILTESRDRLTILAHRNIECVKQVLGATE